MCMCIHKCAQCPFTFPPTPNHQTPSLPQSHRANRPPGVLIPGDLPSPQERGPFVLCPLISTCRLRALESACESRHMPSPSRALIPRRPHHARCMENCSCQVVIYEAARAMCCALPGLEARDLGKRRRDCVSVCYVRDSGCRQRSRESTAPSHTTNPPLQQKKRPLTHHNPPNHHPYIAHTKYNNRPRRERPAALPLLPPAGLPLLRHAHAVGSRDALPGA